VRIGRKQARGLRQRGNADVGEAAAETRLFVDRNLSKLCPGHLERVAIDAGCALQIRIVQQDRLMVGTQLHVELHETRAELERRAQCRERVLRILRSVAAVSDELGNLGERRGHSALRQVVVITPSILAVVQTPKDSIRPHDVVRTRHLLSPRRLCYVGNRENPCALSCVTPHIVRP
jgi:hypothetical protein